MPDEKDVVFVNTKMPIDLATTLDQMAKDDESDRSKFIRKLIRQEYARRMQLPLPAQEKKPSKRIVA